MLEGFEVEARSVGCQLISAIRLSKAVCLLGRGRGSDTGTVV